MTGGDIDHGRLAVHDQDDAVASRIPERVGHDSHYDVSAFYQVGPLNADCLCTLE